FLGAFDRARLIPFARRELLFGFVEQLTVLARAEIVEARELAVGRCLPVMAPTQPRTREIALFGWFSTRNQNRTPVFADSVSPRHLRVRLGGQYLSARPVERIKKAVSIGLDQSLDLAAFAHHIHEHRIADRIPVVYVVRRELIVPLQLSCIGVERDDAA